MKLESLVSFVGGGTPSKNNQEYWNGKIPWASVKDIKSKFISKTEDYISDQGLANSASTLVSKGTVILPTRMALGKVAIAGVDIAINQDLKGLLIKDPKQISNLFLYYSLRAKEHLIKCNSKGATVKGVTLDFLKQIDINVPDLEKQKSIVAIFNALDHLINLKLSQIQAHDLLIKSRFFGVLA